MGFELHSALNADCVLLGNLPLCQVLLLPDARFPWFILVPRRENVREIYQLSQADQDSLTRESSAFGRAIMTAFKGDKLNIGALGNMVAQLHIHHIVRNVDDPAWPGAVWGYGQAESRSQDDIAKLRAIITGLNLPAYTPIVNA